MEIIEYNNKQEKLLAEKQNLTKILIISVCIDIASTVGVFATLGIGVVIEEIIENFVSRAIANYGKIQLTKFDQLLGALPIPGVTAVTVHCARKLFAIKVEEKITA